MEMLLRNKNAVIYGLGGAIGGAVARAFGREGANVFLAGRTVATLEAVAREAGGIDVCFNAIGIEDVQGTPLIEISVEDFSRPITIATRTQFLTANAVAPHMIKQRSGMTMMITATPARMAFPLVGGFSVACAAMEGFSRSLAAELGPHGVRVVCPRSAGSPESIADTMDDHAAGNGMTRDEFITSLKEMTLLKRLPSFAEVGNVSVLMASHYAGTMTGTVANMTSGQIVH